LTFRVDAPSSHLHLQLTAASTDLSSFVCPNNTSSRQLLDFLGLLVPPYLDARAPNGSLPFPQPESCLTDLRSRVLPRGFLSFAASAAARNTTGHRRFVSLDETTRHKPLGQNGTELTWRPWVEEATSSTEQRSGRLGFFSCKGFPQGCTILGLQLLAILGIMVLLPSSVESYLIYLCKRILGWRGMCSR
jgi:hypothetical protein